MGRSASRTWPTAPATKSVAELLEELAGDRGMGWSGIAEVLGVSVSAIRKWRKGGDASPDSRLILARITALLDVLEEKAPIADPAGWMEMDLPLAAGYFLRPLDLYLEGHTDALLDLAERRQEAVQVLDLRAYDTLGSMVDALPRTSDPAGDLVSAGVDGFRAFAIGHPGLFRIGIQLTDAPPAVRPHIRAAADHALATLIERLERLRAAGGLDSRPLLVAASQFHATCEGLAAAELRGTLAHTTDPMGIWVGGLAALVRGWHPAGCPQTFASG
jgi:transcriptional regulator with XRE-family HTH domain